jgi:carbonic anhydrase/acetyltransferase-like protein (isoleucine patch superfamily)
MAMLVEFEGRRPRVAKSAFLAPTAVLLADVQVGENASIWFGAVLRADLAPIRIGSSSNIQDNVVIHADSTEGTFLEERVTVGHGAILHDCWIGKDSLIGIPLGSSPDPLGSNPGAALGRPVLGPPLTGPVETGCG